jgi:hypothetical protein
MKTEVIIPITKTKKNTVTVSKVTPGGGSRRISMYFGGHTARSILASIPVRLSS